MSRRRDQKEIVGFVNFPIDDPKTIHTKEGGMFVRLVVVDQNKINSTKNKWQPCCGGSQSFIWDESFINDDFHSKHNEALKYHFPNYYSKSVPASERYLSREYLSIITLAATGWSGYNKEKQGYWYCEHSNLSEQGKLLYNQIRSLYNGCQLFLLTFLDT